MLTLLLLSLGCAHHPDVAATASIVAPGAPVEPVVLAPVPAVVVIPEIPEIPESQLAPGTDCKVGAYLPSWTLAISPSVLPNSPSAPSTFANPPPALRATSPRGGEEVWAPPSASPSAVAGSPAAAPAGSLASAAASAAAPASSPSTASLPGTDVIVSFPPGLTVDPSSRPHHVVLTSAPVPAHPQTVVELWIVPVCRSYSVPIISTRMSQASMFSLVGVHAAIDPGNLTIGDGIYLAGQGHLGDGLVPLWFRWVEVLHSADFGVAVAASCERTGRTSVCETGVARMVDAVRAQAQAKP